MFDLPPHLQALNALPSHSPPSSALSHEQEEAFWAFLNTDELFSSFGVPASTFEDKKNAAASTSATPAAAVTAAATPTLAPAALADAPTPGTGTERRPAQPTLESFLATFANEHAHAAASSSSPLGSSLSSMAMANSYLLPLPLPYTSPADTAAATAQTPHGVNTADIMPVSAAASASTSNEPETPYDDRVTGAKRLKQLGAEPAVIEEDKRRRNTEASARFRAKKKEREQALEQRAKELERQVAALVAEKASLEKENNLLKFIVVNGSGGQPGAAAGAGAGASVAQLSSAEGLQAALAALGKRKRDE
ncbi:hypothetical protein Q5752_006172 [Cryptotrichosporon argae]